MAPTSPSLNEVHEVVFGSEYTVANEPNASQDEEDDARSVSTPEAEEREERQESMYVTILDDAIIGVLEREKHLFTDDELACLRAYNLLDVDVKFLYARCCARQPRWLRLSDMKNWMKRLEEDFIPALRMLSNNPDLLESPKPKVKPQRTSALRSGAPKSPFVSPVKRPLRKPPPEVIDLTSDDEEVVEQLVTVVPTASASSSTSPEPQPVSVQPVSVPPISVPQEGVQQEAVPDYTRFMQCRSFDSSDWNWPEMLGMLTVEDLKDMVKMLVLKVSAKKDKQGLTDAILARVAPELSGKESGKRQTSLLEFDDGLHYRKWVMDRLGVCVRFNPHIHELMLRVNIIYLRCTQLPEGFLTAPILDKSNRRNYTDVAHQRTNEIWMTRSDFMRYYKLLHIAADVEWLLNPRTAKPPSGRYVDALAYRKRSEELGHKGVVATSHAVWSIMNDNKFLEEWRNMVAYEADDEIRTRGLERFEAGHVLTRLVHKAADALGPLKKYDTELGILNELLEQKRWRLGRRGFWHERRTLILERYVDEPKSLAARETALQATIEGLADPHTHIIHREGLDKRLHRLEKALNLPEDDRHECAVQRGKLPEIRITATQVQAPKPALKLALDKAGRPMNTVDISVFFSAQKSGTPSTPKGKAVATPTPLPDAKTRARTGRTAWIGRDGSIVTVEQVALEFYEGKGYKGYHCEGGIIRTLFGLLFWTVIFAPVPGAFETPYQIAPLDMCDETFATSRADAIAARVQEIRDGCAVEVFERVDADHREKRTMCTGVNWDFEHDELKEILECFDGEALALLCELLCEDYSKRTSGLPDLFLWHPEKRHVKLSEVKSPNDRLAQHQKVWLEVLCGAGVDAEVCHVHDPEFKVKSEPKVKTEGKVKTEPKVKPEGKVKSESKVKSEPKPKVEQVKPKAEGKGKSPAAKGTSSKRKRAEVKSEPDLSDVEDDQLRDDPEGDFSPAPARATPSTSSRTTPSAPKRAAPAPAPSDDDVSTPPPSKRPRRAAADAPKRYKHTDEEMQL